MYLSSLINLNVEKRVGEYFIWYYNVICLSVSNTQVQSAERWTAQWFQANSQIQKNPWEIRFQSNMKRMLLANLLINRLQCLHFDKCIHIEIGLLIDICRYRWKKFEVLLTCELAQTNMSVDYDFPLND